MKIPFRSGRIRWDLVGWLLALVGALMSLFDGPAEVAAPATDQVTSSHDLTSG